MSPDLDPDRTLAEMMGSGQLRPEPAPIRSFAALGDSFTAGTGSEPGAGWADRLAVSLRARCPDLVYRNLAWEGAPTTALASQLPDAIGLEPDLVSIVSGANDVLESVRPEPAQAVMRLAAAFDEVRDAVPGVTLLTATLPEGWRFYDIGPRTAARVKAGIEGLNEGIRLIAAQRDIPCLDVAVAPGLHDSENYSQDGLHPSALGHARAAAAFELLIDERRST